MTSWPPDPLPIPGPEPWLRSNRPLARRVARPLQRFTGIEAAGGAVLLVATVTALVWANSPWRASYVDVFHTEIAFSFGGYALREDLTHWINDGLMVIFFFVVGMEIKLEFVSGELRERRAAVLPVFAALGGMLVPPALYLAINAGGPGARGWGIPMATDIAFALGAVALLGSRVPPPLKVFLLTLAVIDDLGAIAVIAVFYTELISWAWLAGAAVILLAVVVLRQIRVRYLPAYVVLGTGLWLCLLESGIHATLAGVTLGLLTPAVPLLTGVDQAHVSARFRGQHERSAADVQDVAFLNRESVSPAERLTHALHPWSAFIVIPLFALANAGIEVSAKALSSPANVTLGVLIGLVVGKTMGIAGFSWIAVRLGFGVLPAGVRFVQLVGIAAIAGIGFTVSLFISGLAFPNSPGLVGEAKVGILVASALAAVFGAAILVLSAPSVSADEPSVGDSAGAVPGDPGGGLE